MLSKRLFDNRWRRTGLLFMLLCFAIPKTFAALVLTTPEPGTENYPYSEMGLWWKYDEDPIVAAEISEQVKWIGLRLYEVDDPNVFKVPKTSDFVGRCRSYYPCWWCSFEFQTKFRYPRTFASTAECGEELKPNQWYKWSVWVERDGGPSLAKAVAFKTGDYRDIIIDDSSAGFTQGGPGPFSERGRGYKNSSLLVNTTWEENENNYCQWEWTIPEERTYEVLVYMPLKFFSASRMGSSEQAIYKLWREGIPGPDYKSTTIIDQTKMDANSLWMSIGTFHFRAGQASLRLNDNTGESAPLGRQLVCDAVKVRPRLGTVGKPDAGITASSVRRRGTRSLEGEAPSDLLYPMDWQIIPSSGPEMTMVFNWTKVKDATLYRIQVIQQEEPKDSKDSEDSEKTPKFDDGNSDKCKQCIFNDNVTEDTDSKFKITSSFEFGKTYYWRARAEKKRLFGWWLSNIGKWSKVRQFKVIESPTAGGKYPAKCQELQQKGDIDFGQEYKYTDPFKNKKFIDRTDAIAQICYPEGQDMPMPIVLFLHGDYENCYQTCKDCKETDKKTGKVAFFDWQGVDQIISPMTCPTKDIFPSYKGFKYLQKELASHGLFTISISAHDIQGHKENWIVEARSKLIVKFVEKLKAWNEKGTDLFNDTQKDKGKLKFKGKLNLAKVGLVGHSRGGEAILAAAQSLRGDDEKKKGPVVAMVAMAPNNEESHQPGDIPYYLLQGVRDNDMFALQGLVTYQHYENQAAPKMKALVYGANHNFFNEELKKDDGEGTEYFLKSKMTAEKQQEVTRTTTTAFMRWHLLGEEKYQAILNGSYKHPRIFWGYNAGNNNLKVIDDFEQVFDRNKNGYGKKQNTLGGTNSFNGKRFYERILYTFPSKDKRYKKTQITWDTHFFEQTMGMKLIWSVTKGTTRKTTAIYRTNYRIVPNKDKTLPPPVSNWPYLSLLAANVVPSGKEEPKIFSENQTSISLGVTLETKTGETEEAKRSQTVNSSALARIPHPYQRTWIYCRDLEDGFCIDNEQAVLTGIRIPLAEFGFNKEELNNLTAIEIEVDALGNSEGNIALDDIFFTQ